MLMAAKPEAVEICAALPKFPPRKKIAADVPESATMPPSLVCTTTETLGLPLLAIPTGRGRLSFPEQECSHRPC